MPPEDDDAGDKPATVRTFTQSEVNALIKDRLAREREKYADYDELKAKAQAAEGSQSQLDKIEQQLAAMQTRAENAERETMRREVADELGLTPRQAKRLHGKTRDELLDDGKEMLEDLGIDPKASKGKKAGNNQNNDDSADEGNDEGTDDPEEETPPARQASSRVGRPRETLRPGATRTPATPEETDPMKLAALIPRR